jgi:uncharacterized membrane protein YoaK (UPF0700 family)
MSATPAEPRPGRGPFAGRVGDSIRDPLARGLLVMTFSTGLVDAVSYLGLGRVFTANMTGNIVLLGFGIAGSVGLPVVAPLVSLGAFLVGSAVGGAMATRIAHRHARHVARALGIETALVLAAAIVAATADVEPSTVSGDAVIALLALAMGVRNATVRRLAVPDLTTTVLTMTLTGLAADAGRGRLRARLGAQDRCGAGDAARGDRRGAAAQDQPRPAAPRRRGAGVPRRDRVFVDRAAGRVVT